MTMPQLIRTAKQEGVVEYTGPEEAGPDLQDPQGAGQAERPDVRRGDARSPARRVRLPPQPRLQLPPLPRRHLRLAQPDPPVRPQDRRDRRRPDPPAQGERAVLRPAPGRGDQLRRPRQAQREGRLRRPDPAPPARPAQAGDRRRRAEHAGRRHGHPDRQGPARPDRRAARGRARRSCSRRSPTASSRTTPTPT